MEENIPVISQFKLFERFHFFYYSRKNDQTFFLLRQKKNGQFAEIRGHLEPYDPAILFSVGRKIVESSCGLLTQHNLQFFSEESDYPEVRKDMLQLCRPRQQIPSLLNCKLFQKFIEDTFETMKPYQESDNNDAYYFVEIPYLDLQKLNNFCLTYSIKLNLKYASLEEILSCDSSVPIHDSLQTLFTPELISYTEKYISGIEPIPVNSRYAIVCIMTTPTNYRTMGLLGSYYKKHGEQWKLYRFPVEEPTREELSQLNGLLIPGATVCAADKSLVWRDKLLTLIRTVYQDYPSCKILGTCFGIQIISEALNGRCERMKEAVRGSSKIAIRKQFWDLSYIKELNLENKEGLIVSKSHFDAVTEAPEMATVYG